MGVPRKIIMNVTLQSIKDAVKGKALEIDGAEADRLVQRGLAREMGSQKGEGA